MSVDSISDRAGSTRPHGNCFHNTRSASCKKATNLQGPTEKRGTRLMVPLAVRFHMLLLHPGAYLSRLTSMCVGSGSPKNTCLRHGQGSQCGAIQGAATAVSHTLMHLKELTYPYMSGWVGFHPVLFDRSCLCRFGTQRTAQGLRNRLQFTPQSTWCFSQG
jgi:hypothetical protein